MNKLIAAAALGLAAVAAMAGADAPNGAAAPAPTLTYVFSIRATLDPAVEVGQSEGGRRRFIAVTGGEVYGPRLRGKVLDGGGDWQTILPGGLTKVEAKYFVKTDQGAVIEVTNPGLRTASAEVVERLAKGEDVDPSLYYFRTTPNFRVGAPELDWMQRHAFVARGIRRPDHVVIDYYMVE
ncbi:DUF3237 domain-containing protein [Novosphingobium sp. B 225]|uniref:DUF3237 domain-containing protein n=1 Tax=Novosphingobium sp. B 225 TaxID=1961849 RepID=UPI000B4A76F4|nr:DUF3237 domain-containing protein [Novosphingobium sp. B 225]